MRQKGRGNFEENSVWLPLFLAVCFLCGAVLGHIFAGGEGYGGGDELKAYLAQFLQMLEARDPIAAPFLQEMISYWKYILVAFALGYISFGGYLIPLIAFFYGFSVSFAASSMLQAMGIGGLWLPILLLGVRSMIVLPAFLLIASDSMMRTFCGKNASDRRKKSDREQYTYLLHFIGALVVLGAAALAEHLYLGDLLYAICPLIG